MLYGSQDGREVWGRMDTYIYMAKALPCSLETITTLLVGYTPIHNKKFIKKKSTSGQDMCVEAHVCPNTPTEAEENGLRTVQKNFL